MKTEYIKSGAPKQTHPCSIKLQLNFKTPFKKFSTKRKERRKGSKYKKERPFLDDSFIILKT